MRLQAFAGAWRARARHRGRPRRPHRPLHRRGAASRPAPGRPRLPRGGHARLRRQRRRCRRRRRYLWRDGGAGAIEVLLRGRPLLPPLRRRGPGAGRRARLPARHLPRPLRLPRLAALAGRMARHRPAQGLRHASAASAAGATMRTRARSPLALLAACAPGPGAGHRAPTACCRAMRACLADPRRRRTAPLVDRARGFVVIKDDDPAKPDAWLLVPDDEVTGIEDPAVFGRRSPTSGATAGRSGADLAARRRRGARPRDQLVAGRSQNLLHIHISCVAARRSRDALAGAADRARTGRAAPFIAFGGHAYNARKVGLARAEPVPAAARAARRRRGHGRASRWR